MYKALNYKISKLLLSCSKSPSLELSLSHKRQISKGEDGKIKTIISEETSGCLINLTLKIPQFYT